MAKKAMTDEEILDVWFTYHQPTEETTPKFKAVGMALKEFTASFARTRTLQETNLARAPEEAFQIVTSAARAVVVAILEHCPACSQRSDAVKHIRLARNAANDMLCGRDEQVFHDLFAQNVTLARYLANTAIACDGV